MVRTPAKATELHSIVDSTQKDPSVEPDQIICLCLDLTLSCNCLSLHRFILLFTSSSTDDLTAADRELTASAAAVHNQR